MSEYIIRLCGCDDSTEFEIELGFNELETVKKIAKKSQETATYQCMPIMEVYEIKKELKKVDYDV